MKMKLLKPLTAILLLYFPTTSEAIAASDRACFESASQRYGIPVNVLKAISRTESGGNSSAISRNTNGSYDIGHMQINSNWLPALAKFGITQQHLLNPCTNTHVGAWILSSNFRRLGYNWRAVGAYNARSPEKAAKYARKVADNMQKEEVALD